MEKVCSLCNGLEVLNIQCDFCGHMMKNQGCLSDYYGPYSPYDAVDSEGETVCTHLFYCPHCHNDRRVSIPLKELSCEVFSGKSSATIVQKNWLE